MRGKGQMLQPALKVGNQGVTESVMAQIESHLSRLGLMKIKFTGSLDQKDELTQRISEELRAEIVGQVGHTVLLFRNPRETDKESRVAKKKAVEPQD